MAPLEQCLGWEDEFCLVHVYLFVVVFCLGYGSCRYKLYPVSQLSGFLRGAITLIGVMLVQVSIGCSVHCRGNTKRLVIAAHVKLITAEWYLYSLFT